MTRQQRWNAQQRQLRQLGAAALAASGRPDIDPSGRPDGLTRQQCWHWRDRQLRALGAALARGELQAVDGVRTPGRDRTPSPPTPPVTHAGGFPPGAPPTPNCPDGDRVAAVAELVRATGAPLVLTRADRRAIVACSAEPEVIAEAFSAAASGRWTGGDDWLRQNLSLKTVIQRLPGYLATARAPSPPGRRNRTIGAVPA